MEYRSRGSRVIIGEANQNNRPELICQPVIQENISRTKTIWIYYLKSPQPLEKTDTEREWIILRQSEATPWRGIHFSGALAPAKLVLKGCHQCSWQGGALMRSEAVTRCVAAGTPWEGLRQAKVSCGLCPTQGHWQELQSGLQWVAACAKRGGAREQLWTEATATWLGLGLLWQEVWGMPRPDTGSEKFPEGQLLVRNSSWGGLLRPLA